METAPSLPAAVASRLQPGGDLVDDHRVLVLLVLDVGEHVGQQLALAELLPASTRTR